MLSNKGAVISPVSPRDNRKKKPIGRPKSAYLYQGENNEISRKELVVYEHFTQFRKPLP